MSLVGHKVNHSKYGEGVINHHTDQGYLTIRFKDGDKLFKYPDSFLTSLSMIDETIQSKITSEAIDSQRKQKEESLKIDEVIRENISKDRYKETRNVYRRENVAFKCTYCDGGKSSDHIGFKGLCSAEIIRYNVKIKKHRWCTAPDSLCTQYSNGHIKTYLELMDISQKMGFVCYESAMLRDWSAYAGVYRSEDKDGVPMKLKWVRTNNLAVLTTRMPNAEEKDRIIFAAFLVTEADEGDTVDSGFVSAGSSQFKIEMKPNEANKLRFWDYYYCPNAQDKIIFGSGLHRYLSDNQAVQILKDIVKIKKGTPQQRLAEQFLDHFVSVNRININQVPEKGGALQIMERRCAK